MTPPNPPTPQSVSLTGTGEFRAVLEEVAAGSQLCLDNPAYRLPAWLCDRIRNVLHASPATPPKMNAGETPSEEVKAEHEALAALVAGERNITKRPLGADEQFAKPPAPTGGTTTPRTDREFDHFPMSGPALPSRVQKARDLCYVLELELNAAKREIVEQQVLVSSGEIHLTRRANEIADFTARLALAEKLNAELKAQLDKTQA